MSWLIETTSVTSDSVPAIMPPARRVIESSLVNAMRSPQNRSKNVANVTIMTKAATSRRSPSTRNHSRNRVQTFVRVPMSVP
ncbi:hypothetical protein [Natrialbaceae archaeon AArc-T1-2]|uniref:hypothetical protein n=1 Tax=Natrialbaceae archaeon AArc-T1-2 TaxID=3053904 RepID=UPI0031F2E596